MTELPEINLELVHQDTRIKLSEALESESKYKALAQQLFDRVNELEQKLASSSTSDDTPTE